MASTATETRKAKGSTVKTPKKAKSLSFQQHYEKQMQEKEEADKKKREQITLCPYQRSFINLNKGLSLFISAMLFKNVFSLLRPEG